MCCKICYIEIYSAQANFTTRMMEASTSTTLASGVTPGPSLKARPLLLQWNMAKLVFSKSSSQFRLQIPAPDQTTLFKVFIGFVFCHHYPLTDFSAEYTGKIAIVQGTNFSNLFILSREQNLKEELLDERSISKFYFRCDLI